tara:strand:- start:26048 stop:26239 length:192 start_codon:yes stop_codon:yes gene_type:complete
MKLNKIKFIVYIKNVNYLQKWVAVSEDKNTKLERGTFDSELKAQKDWEEFSEENRIRLWVYSK